MFFTISQIFCLIYGVCCFEIDQSSTLETCEAVEFALNSPPFKYSPLLRADLEKSFFSGGNRPT